MRFFSRLRSWFRRREEPRSDSQPTVGPLREFVYLDEISVYSILASRKGSIATEVTESHTASQEEEISGSISAGVGSTKATTDSRMQTGRVQGTQVLRKAIVQTSFAELYDLEHTSHMWKPPTECKVPEVSSLDDIRRQWQGLTTEMWIIDPKYVCRGQLLEVEVELQADPIFRLASIINTLWELLANNESFVDRELVAQLSQMRSIAEVLEGLLSGLVPIRGRIVEYDVATIEEREVLVHKTILDRMAPHSGLVTCPAYVVGVAERDLFWKDIRRVLFSNAPFTVFCRISRTGLGIMSESHIPPGGGRSCLCADAVRQVWGSGPAIGLTG